MVCIDSCDTIDIGDGADTDALQHQRDLENKTDADLWTRYRDDWHGTDAERLAIQSLLQQRGLLRTKPR